MTAPPEIHVDAANARPLLGWRELWRYRELLAVLVRRDLAVRYQQTALGVGWALLQPLGMMAIFSVVFGRFGRFGQDLEVPYPLFALAGLLPWLLFAGAATAASQSLLGSRALLSKVYFPRLIIPAAALGAPLLDFFVGNVLLAAVVLAYGLPLGPQLLALPLLALLTVLVAFGVGSLLSALVVMYRDVRHVVPFLIMVWMFLTPVIYPPALLGADWRWLLYANPLAGLVEGMRWAWLGTPLDPALLAGSVVSTAIALAVALEYFRRVERDLADVI